MGKQRPKETSEESNLKIQIDEWYNNNIGNNETYATKIAVGKFCNDRNMKTGQNWETDVNVFQHAPYERLAEKKELTLLCDREDVYELKAGAITVDEVGYAGGAYNSNNTSYYLYNNTNYWTMSPANMYIDIYAFCVNSSGSPYNIKVNSTTPGIRPVINLRSDVTFQDSGDGTQNNPYIVAN